MPKYKLPTTERGLTLTARRQHVFELLQQGVGRSHIAHELEVSESCVRYHTACLKLIGMIANIPHKNGFVQKVYFKVLV